MKRRDFCASSLLLLSGCGGEMAEWQLQPSPTRKAYGMHSDVPNYAQATSTPNTLLNGATVSRYVQIGDYFSYEEGEFIPALGGSATYVSQGGRFTRTGRKVVFDVTLGVNTIGTGSTTVISGLPYNALGSSAVTVVSTISSVTNITAIAGRIDGSASTITLLSRTAATNFDTTNAIFQNSTTIILTGSYIKE